MARAKPKSKRQPTPSTSTTTTRPSSQDDGTGNDDDIKAQLVENLTKMDDLGLPLPGTDIPSSFSFAATGNLLVFLDKNEDNSSTRYLACLKTETLERYALLKPSNGGGDTEQTLSLEEKLRRERQRIHVEGVTSFSWCGSRGLLIPLQGCLYLLNPRDAKPELSLVLGRGQDFPTLDARSSPNGTHIAFVRGGDLYTVTYDEVSKVFASSAATLVSYPPTNNAPGRTNGLASFLAQEEMDRQHGYWWSPDSAMIAYERVDETAIPSYRIVHQSDQVEEEEHRYPFAGASNPATQLCLGDLNKRVVHGDRTTPCPVLDLTMSRGETDVYLGRVDWFSARFLFVQVMNRDQNRLELLCFDCTAVPPARTVLLSETTNSWINLNDHFDPLERTNRFLWGSERSGFQHLYLYKFSSDGGGAKAELVKQVTQGNFVVDKVVGLAPKDEEDLVYFTGNARNATERHLYVARLMGDGENPSPMLRLTQRGSNYVTFDSQCRRFVLNHSSLDRTPQVTLQQAPDIAVVRQRIQEASSAKHKRLPAKRSRHAVAADDDMRWVELTCDNVEAKDLMEVLDDEDHQDEDDKIDTKCIFHLAGSKTTSDSAQWRLMTPAMMRFNVESTVVVGSSSTSSSSSSGDTNGHKQRKTNVPLFAQVFLPTNKRKFGPGPYPTIVFVYGGPHVQRVKNEWYSTMDLRPQLLASKGFLVVKCDNRGSSRRGVEFESAIKHRMGTVELDDQISCIQALASRGLCDLSRVGITGWSYGGYLTAMALCRHPTVFRVGISGAPVVDWDGYDSAYTERYMSTPQKNPEGYADGSVLTHVSKIVGNLLLIHGLVDENVHFRHTARLIDALIANNKPYDLLLLPNERHSPRKAQTRAYIDQKSVDYFVKHLL